VFTTEEQARQEAYARVTGGTWFEEQTSAYETVPEQEKDLDFVQPQEVAKTEDRPIRARRVTVTRPTTDDRKNWVDQDFMYAVLAEKYGENFAPAYQIRLEVEMAYDMTKGLHTEPRFLRSIARSALLAEGDGYFHWMKWWMRCSMAILLVGCLLSGAMLTFWRPQGAMHFVFSAGSGVLTPIYMAVAFSLGCLGLKQGLYGWRRLLRLFWVRCFQNRSRTAWLGIVRSLGDYSRTKRERS